MNQSIVGKNQNQTFRISGVTMFGPLEEKDAMNGAGLVPSFALGGVIYATGLLLYHMPKEIK